MHPEGFWEQLREHHQELWADPARTKGWPAVCSRAADRWYNPGDTTTVDARTDSSWRAYRLFGGRKSWATLNVTRLILSDTLDGGTANEAFLTTNYVYAFPEVNATDTPALVVARYATISGDPDTPRVRQIMHNADEVRQGLRRPELADYQQLLAEMAVGASGQYRIVLG